MANEVVLSRQAVTALVAETLKGVDAEAGLSVEHVDESTELLGRLDSLGLVTLIVDIEERLQDELGIAVALATERALSQRHSPFRTVGTLADYILDLAEGANSQ